MLDSANRIQTPGFLDLNCLQPILKWCHHDGLQDARLDVLLSKLIDELHKLGIHFDRVNLTLPTLHPQLAAESAEWHADKPVSYVEYAVSAEKSDSFKGSPVEAILNRDVSMLDIPLEGDAPLAYKFCEDLRSKNYTGYLILGIEAQDKRPNLISFATKEPGGFHSNHVQMLRLVADALAPMLAFQRMRRIARNICHTYIGPQTGARVLDGAIHRGTVEKLNAVVWFCDLRQFTQLSESLGIDGVTEFVNEFFEVISNAVNEHEGEILKFIGDAALAIFPIPSENEAPRICQDALLAVSRVEAEFERVNAVHREGGRPEIEFGIGLNLGEVSYGNVGSTSRLDFTVIGSAVNLASRLENLSAQTEHRVLISESFAKAVDGKNLTSIGVHQLKGIQNEQQVFCRS